MRGRSISCQCGQIYLELSWRPTSVCELLGATLATYDQLYTAWEAGLQKCTYVLLYSSIIVFIYDSFCFFASWLFMFELKNVSSFLKEQVVS